MDLDTLLETLRNVEALQSGATTPGEARAAGLARERLMARLREFEITEQPVEFRFTMPDLWNRRLFVALLRRYGLVPYRYKRQRRTTVMVRVPPSFVDETLLPQFREYAKTLQAYLEDVTQQVIQTVLESDGSEVDVVDDTPALG